MDDNTKYVIIRDRWDKEDNLLLSRTGIFLTVNSILCAGAQLQQALGFRAGIGIFSIVLSTIWLTTSWHSFNVIFYLYGKCFDYMPEDIKGIYKLKPILFRPTTVFGIVLPITVILGWIFYAALNIKSLMF
jgi:hypothetical protein